MVFGKDEHWIGGRFTRLVIIPGLYLLGFLVIAVCVWALSIVAHDTSFGNYEEQTTYMGNLDDIKYMDNGEVLYRFGDTVIKHRFIGTRMEMNKNYDVVFRRCSNCWINSERVWIIKTIKAIN